jgi:hypothetical protein
MTDTPETPPPEPRVTVAEQRKRASERKAKEKRGRVAWLSAARVVDMDAFHRLREKGCGARKLSKALSTTPATAQKLMAGVHWQQNPEKVAEFNRFHHASVDPATGVPSPNDLIKHGGAYAQATRHDSEGEKDLRRIAEDAGISPAMVTESVRRMQLLSGMADTGELPEVPDTKYLQDTIDKKLAMTLSLLDSVTLAGASVADLTRLFNGLTEKRRCFAASPRPLCATSSGAGWTSWPSC